MSLLTMLVVSATAAGGAEPSAAGVGSARTEVDLVTLGVDAAAATLGAVRANASTTGEPVAALLVQGIPGAG
ncbi:MAG: hypothetical protein M3O86_05735, partial [Actinomycetota bacterium]|nr:hypothetical protein [Actinomycetota bacterium]